LPVCQPQSVHSTQFSFGSHTPSKLHELADSNSHELEHPSPSFVFPSSQASLHSTTPSPHSDVQLAQSSGHVADVSFPLHTPSPQLGFAACWAVPSSHSGSQPAASARRTMVAATAINGLQRLGNDMGYSGG